MAEFLNSARNNFITPQPDIYGHNSYGIDAQPGEFICGTTTGFIPTEEDLTRTSVKPSGSAHAINGSTAISGGSTSASEHLEVSTRLSESRYNRDTITGGRAYSNYSFSSSTTSSANESTALDRGDFLENAINVGRVTYRNGASTHGQIGYTNNGMRDLNDFYRFEVGKSGRIEIALSGLSQDIGLSLYSNRGTVIQTSDRRGASGELIQKDLERGDYIVRIYSYPQTPWFHGATFYTLNMSRNADPLETYWRDILGDSSVENAALNSIQTDNSLSREDVIGIIKSAADYGSVTGEEIRDLRTFYDRAINNTNVKESIRVLSRKVLFQERSNEWYTGSDSIRAKLGDLYAGSSASHLSLLIGKHFLGTDRPAIAHSGTGQPAGTYTNAVGSLFVDNISADDVIQGIAADCYFLSALAGTAIDKAGIISNMLEPNNDGSWSVRFHVGGRVEYVTVDSMFPTDSNGNYLYANQGLSVSGFNELWAPLAEKAYAQLNESGGIKQDGNNYYGNEADAGISWGDPALAITHVSGLAASTKSIDDLSDTSLINLVMSSKIVTIFNFNKGTDTGKSKKTLVDSAVSKHVYSITNYDHGTGLFAIHNPWGHSHLNLTIAELRSLKGEIAYSVV